jgi:hypothetical protein
MKSLKKNISNAKGKGTNLNSKLSEDMVIVVSSRKIKSRTPSPSMIPTTRAMLLGKT